MLRDGGAINAASGSYEAVGGTPDDDAPEGGAPACGIEENEVETDIVRDGGAISAASGSYDADCCSSGVVREYCDVGTAVGVIAPVDIGDMTPIGGGPAAGSELPASASPGKTHLPVLVS